MSGSGDMEKKRRWIRPLPERVINKIAAGEVVERPASVVKELVENSLDAGAHRIEVFILNSGARLIKIVDNGCGIGEDQIEIAFSRHATSKISEFRDLDRILSYGFRGEALPSIASVSRMRMVSRPADTEIGTEIVYEGGVLQSRQPIATPPGTTIEVENLFFNTPARRKFLKAESTEARHISRVVTAMAIGRYDVGISYHLNSRKIFALPDSMTLAERVPALLAASKKFIGVTGELGPLKVEGYVGLPDLAQSNRNGQYIFVNSRLVHSPSLSHAFSAGYGDLLPRGNFPIGALLLTINPTEIDVNVHPAKTEVRLSKEREIHDALYRLIKEALRQDGIIPSLQLPPGREASVTPQSTAIIDHQQYPPRSSVPEGSADRIPGVRRTSAERAVSDPGLMAELYKNVPPTDGTLPVSDKNANPSVVQVDTSTGEIMSNEMPSDGFVEMAERDSSAGLRLAGRLGDLYLLFQSGDDLLIVDQHTAHERVLFEQTLQQMEAQGGIAQHLLLPVQVELSPEQYALFEEITDLLNHSGFVVSPFGGCTTRIEAVPSILARRSPEKALRAVIDDIGSMKKGGADLKKTIAQSIACRSAVMAGDRLTDQEALALVTSLLHSENRYSCPHGRPTFIRIGRTDLDKQFGRG